VLSGLPALQVNQNFHVAVEAGGTAGEVLWDKRIGLLGVLGQATSIRNPEDNRFAVDWGTLRKDTCRSTKLDRPEVIDFSAT
jgi:hypothetical protein